ncbi:MAG TPA: hypothetical protein VGM51_04230 [Armatimonadota bacterium]|jgi:hypothetical protein
MLQFFSTPQHGWKLALCVIGTIVVFVAIMALIHPTANAVKKRITMVLAFAGGLLYLLEFIVPANVYIGRTVHKVDGKDYSAVVTSAGPNTPGAAFQPGDTFLKWGKAATPDHDALNAAIANAAAGQIVPVTVLRNNAPASVTFTMPPAPKPAAGEGDNVPPVTAEKLGLSVQDTGNPFTPFMAPLGSALRIFLALALLLGIVNLFRVNGRTLFRRRAGSWYALAFFFGFFAMVTVWALTYYHPGVSEKVAQTASTATEHFVPGRMGQYSGWYNVVYNGGFNALGSTMFSLLAFFIVSAAYRAFRVRSFESILLLGSALIMMLGLTPLGTHFITGSIPLDSPYSFLKLERISEWILLVLNGAAQRALLFGIAVGLMATSLRIWLSLERGQFFDAEM